MATRHHRGLQIQGLIMTAHLRIFWRRSSPDRRPTVYVCPSGVVSSTPTRACRSRCARRSCALGPAPALDRLRRSIALWERPSDLHATASQARSRQGRSVAHCRDREAGCNRVQALLAQVLRAGPSACAGQAAQADCAVRGPRDLHGPAHGYRRARLQSICRPVSRAVRNCRQPLCSRMHAGLLQCTHRCTWLQVSQCPHLQAAARGRGGGTYLRAASAAACRWPCPARWPLVAGACIGGSSDVPAGCAALLLAACWPCPCSSESARLCARRLGRSGCGLPATAQGERLGPTGVDCAGLQVWNLQLLQAG